MKFNRKGFALLIAGMAFITSTVSHGALLNVCTYSSGCGPDIFAANTLSASYVTNGYGNGGTLTISGTPSNASFLETQLQGLTGSELIQLPVLPATGTLDHSFEFSMSIGAGGVLQSGSISINGRVIQKPVIGGPLPPPVVVTRNGTTLDGLLVSGTLTQLGLGTASNENGTTVTTFDFTFANDDVAGRFYQAGYQAGAGLATIRTSETDAANIWNTNWSSDNLSFDVVVPLPPAVWLLGSILLGGVLRNRWVLRHSNATPAP